MAHIKALRNKWLAAFAEQQGDGVKPNLVPSKPREQPARQDAADQAAAAHQQTAQNQQQAEQQRQPHIGAVLPKKRLLEASGAGGVQQQARCFPPAAGCRRSTRPLALPLLSPSCPPGRCLPASHRSTPC